MTRSGGASSPVGGLPAKEDITDVDMEITEQPEMEADRLGMKRARDSFNANRSYGSIGVTTAEEKPTLQPHNNGKFLKKAGNGNLVCPDVGDTSKMGGLYLHVTHDSQAQTDSIALRFSSSSPGGDMGGKTIQPTRICTFYAQGQCKNGKSCTSLHEREGSGSYNCWSKEEKAGLLAPVSYRDHRGSEEGSQAQGFFNLKEPLSKDGLYRTLINAYGEDNMRLARNSTTQRPCKINDSWTTKPTPPINELVQIPVNQEKYHKPYFMGRHISSSDGHLDGRDTFPRFHLDGGKLMSDVAKGNSLSDPYVSRAYLGVNSLNRDYRYGPFGSSISFDSLQPSEKFSAYGRPTENLSHKHQKDLSSTLASYNSNSSVGFGNPGHTSSHYSLGSPPLRATSHLGMSSIHQLIPDIKKVGASSPALPVSSSCQLVAMSAGHLSPIKDEPWITSVPFVPSVSLPDTTPSKSQYDPLVDSIDPCKVESTNKLKLSNISCSISSQHTHDNFIMGVDANKSLNCNGNGKLARNTSAKGSNESAGMIALRGHGSSLDGDNMVKSCERRNNATIDEEKTRHFRFHLAEHVKELLQPFWKEGKLSKDAHKLIVKKSVDKVLSSLGPHQIPATKELISEYITMFGTKIEKLVKAYVDRHHTR